MFSKFSRGRKPLHQLSRRQHKDILSRFRSDSLSTEYQSQSSTSTDDNFPVEIPLLHREHENRVDNLLLPIADVPIVREEPVYVDDDSMVPLADDFIDNASSDDMSINQCSQSSHESISETEDKQPSFQNDLASWVVDNSISAVASDKLLQILRSHSCFSNLPKSTKTLVATPRQAAVFLNVPPGQYLSFGFQAAIVMILDSVDDDEIPEQLEVDISTDGANLDNSGKNQIWPIQCRIANIRNSRTEVIGIYKGNKKPDDFVVFFQPMADEVTTLIQNGGVVYRGRLKTFVLRAFIADAPARASSLNHYGHTSEHPCSKCWVAGEYRERRMTLCGIDFRPRTDEEYSRQIDEDHHREGPCPLSFLPIGLVSQVPFEYMHLVLLGVVKRMLSAWIDGKFSNNSRLSAHDISLISMRLVYLSDYCPREFARPPRDLKFYLRFKATEFRQFLLYTGPAVLFGLLNDDLYNHFLLLHASLRILASPLPSKEKLVFAELALRVFVQQSPNLYGQSFVSYNVHGLLHLVNDVKLLGPVDTYSAFPFENNMQIFRKYCRKPDMPLQQIANRRAELAHKVIIGSRRVDLETVALERHTEGPLITNNANDKLQQYRRLKCRKFVLTREKRDNCCLLKDSTICIVVNIVVRQAEIFLIVKKFHRVEPFYDVAIPSSSIGYYKCRELLQDLFLVKFDDVSTKCYVMRHWQPRRLDENGREFLSDDVFVVATMSCEINY